MSSPEGRAVPFFCPYCGDEDLIPEPEPAGAWKCESCRRVFAVRMVGLALGNTGSGTDAGEDVGPQAGGNTTGEGES